MNEMKLLSRRTDEIIPYENNPRHNDGAVEAVAASIREFGFKVPIVLDSNGVIVTGHTRLKAAKLLGMEEVPCIMADDLTDEQVKAFRLADNKVAELATWDMERLELELEDIELDMEAFGFDITEMEEPDLDDLEAEDADGQDERFIVKVTFDTYKDWLNMEDEFRKLVEHSNANMVVGSV